MLEVLWIFRCHLGLPYCSNDRKTRDASCLGARAWLYTVDLTWIEQGEKISAVNQQQYIHRASLVIVVGYGSTGLRIGLSHNSPFSGLRPDPNWFAQMKITEHICVFKYQNLRHMGGTLTWSGKNKYTYLSRNDVQQLERLAGWCWATTDPAGAESDTTARTGHGDFPPAWWCTGIVAV